MADPSLKLRPLWLVTGYSILLLIVYLSLTPAPIQFDTGLDWQDKLFHALAYLVLMGWFVQIYHDKNKKLLLVVSFVAVGVGMEFIQSMTPERYFEYADMLANTVGVVLGYLVSLTPLKNVLSSGERFLFDR